MRCLKAPALLRSGCPSVRPTFHAYASSSLILPSTTSQSRCLAQVRSDHEVVSEVWFTSSSPAHHATPENGNRPPQRPPDERTLKLGKTLQTLQSRLPTLLASPLPQEILSPHITLHLFPSTHPHLPNVSGRVPYHAALWTAPVAWGRVPIVGNVRLAIISERMVKNGPSPSLSTSPSYPSQPGSERLIVRWKTCGKTKGKGMGSLYRGIGAGQQVDKITEWLGGDVGGKDEFSGLFIFEFDEEGRVLSHTIEHVEEGGSWDRVGRVVNLTDWLLGRMGRRGKEAELAPAICGEGVRDRWGKRRGDG